MLYIRSSYGITKKSLKKAEKAAIGGLYSTKKGIKIGEDKYVENKYEIDYEGIKREIEDMYNFMIINSMYFTVVNLAAYFEKKYISKWKGVDNDLDELRLVNNVIKHGEGDSLDNIKRKYPYLIGEPQEYTEFYIKLNEDDVMRYMKAVENYFEPK